MKWELCVKIVLCQMVTFMTTVFSPQQVTCYTLRRQSYPNLRYLYGISNNRAECWMWDLQAEVREQRSQPAVYTCGDKEVLHYQPESWFRIGYCYTLRWYVE